MTPYEAGPEELAALRRRLAERGIELPGGFDALALPFKHNLATPHAVFDLDRAAIAMPTYPVIGYVDCLVCGEPLFVSPEALVKLTAHHGLAKCRSCSPAELGWMEVDPRRAALEELARSTDRKEFGNRRPSAEYIRDLLRGEGF